MAPTGNPILGSVVCTSGTGFRFFSDHFHVIGSTFTDYSSNSTTHIGYESGRGFPIAMQRVGGGTFALRSLDAAEFYITDSPDRPEAQMITITGHQLDGGIVTHTINIDGIRDGAGGLVDFEHFVLPSTFVNLTTVVFTGLRAGNLSGGMSIDNLEYELSGGPEPLAPCVAYQLPSDTPSVTITTPAAGNVAGTVLIDAAATDNIGVTGVQMKIDGGNFGAPFSAPPYTVSWDSTTVNDGPHTITVEARDADNNVGTASVVVTVRNHTDVNADPHYLELDGVDDYAQVVDVDSLSFGNGLTDSPLTFELWFRPDVMTKHQFLGKWVDGPTQEYRLQVVAGSIRLDLRDASAGVTVSAFTTSTFAGFVGSWHHLAVSYDGRGGSTAANGITIYLDGIVVPLMRINNAAYVAMENLSAPLQIGRESLSLKQFDGGLDEIRMWNVARTQSEIQAFITTELAGTEPGLVGYWRINDVAGTTMVDGSPGAHSATLHNGPVLLEGGPMGEVTPDITAPEISNVASVNPTDSAVTITFTTNEISSGSVSYSPGTACPCAEAFSGAIGVSHSITLNGLLPDTVYQFTVSARDVAGNLQTAPAGSFLTLPAPPDLIPPTVSISVPLPGATVLGQVAIEAIAGDNRAVTGVQFQIDGVNLGPIDTTFPYTASWDSTTLADGLHTITAIARDGANNLASAAIVVTVENRPVVTTTPHFLELDGVDDYAQVVDLDYLSFGNGTADMPFTFEVWFRPDAMSRNQLFGKWLDGPRQEYRLQIISGLIRLDIRDQSAGATSSVVTANSQTGLIGSWHHLAITYDGRGGPTAANGITMFIDGVSVPLTRLNHPAYVAMENLTAPLQIGRESTGQKHFDGGIDEIRLWNVARTPAHIQAWMSTELNTIETGLVGYWKFNVPGAMVDGDQPGRFPASLYNGAVMLDGGPIAAPAADTTLPNISNIVQTMITDTSARYGFDTNETTTASIVFSLTGVCPCTEVASVGPGVSHVVTLTGLAPNTLYHFTVRARDAAGNQRVSDDMTFTTLPPPPDVAPPTVTIAQPTAGDVSGTVAVDVTAVDNRGVVSVQLLLDGVAAGAPDTVAPYSFSIDTLTLTEGSHTIAVEARDAANNVGSASVTVVVRNTAAALPFYLDLDGVGAYLDAPDADHLSFGNGAADTPLTFEMWLRPDVMTKNQLLGKWVDGPTQEYKLQIVNGSIRLDLRDASASATTSAYTTSTYTSLVGSWHHLAVTYDGRGGATAANGITMYVDGVAVALTRLNNAAYVAMENLSAPLQIGRESVATKQFDGGLDELRMWNVARTQAEIIAAMSTPLSGSEPGLVQYWKFNEGTGSTATDSSASGHPATLRNGVVWVGGQVP